MAKKNDKEYLDIKGMTVDNVRKIGDSGVIGFTLKGKGLGLYNLRVVDGKNGKFVGTPQTKGQDGQWYAQYAVYLTDEDQAKIIKAVEAKVPDEKPVDPADVF